MIYNWYIDIYGKRLVQSTTNSAPVELPKFYQGDVVTLNIYLLDRTGNVTPPFSTINLASYDLKVAVGIKNGTPGSTIYTNQYTWAKAGGNTYFTGDLPFNTAAIDSLIGSSPSNNTAYLEVKAYLNGNPTVILQQLIQIEAQVIDGSNVTPPAGQTALSLETARATFLMQENTGFIVQCATDATKRRYCYVDAEGAWHSDLIP